MNTRRIAELLRRRAQLDLELAEAFEAPEPANDVPSPRRRRGVPVPAVAPTVAPSELDMQRAAQDLRRLGFRVKR